MNAPYLLTAALLVMVALAIAWKARDNGVLPVLPKHAGAGNTNAAI
jgi:hypothetical protein